MLLLTYAYEFMNKDITVNLFHLNCSQEICPVCEQGPPDSFAKGGFPRVIDLRFVFARGLILRRVMLITFPNLLWTTISLDTAQRACSSLTVQMKPDIVNKLMTAALPKAS